MTNGKKTGRLSRLEYLDVLQTEYVVAELRKKIYPKKKDRDYLLRVLEGKKDKIQNICMKDGLPSLFTNDLVRLSFYKSVYGDIGYPDFHYKDADNKEEFYERDFHYYYWSGTDFKVNETGEIKVGKLSSIDRDNSIVHIKIKGDSETRQFKMESASRVV